MNDPKEKLVIGGFEFAISCFDNIIDFTEINHVRRSPRVLRIERTFSDLWHLHVADLLPVDVVVHAIAWCEVRYGKYPHRQLAPLKETPTAVFHQVPRDGGGVSMLHETDTPEYPRDGAS